MKHLLSIFTTIICALSINTLYSAEAPKTLKVKTLLKDNFSVPFTSQTTIAQVKEILKESEGIPALNIKLVKQMDMFLGFLPNN